MLNRLKQRKESGFTIIEVLIVLAIAGLIMVIVFLAVPALQRSQRNQSRKTDVNNVLSAIADFTSNNGGAGPASQADINTVTSNVKFGSYAAAGVFYNLSTVTASGTVVAVPGTLVANAPNVSVINVYSGMVCSSATTAPSTSGANSRNVALTYVVEQASGNGILQCVSS